ncbi:MAG TPA: amidase [Mycobacteriales bacterium]
MRLLRPSAFRTVALLGVAAATTVGLVSPAGAAPATPAGAASAATSAGGPAAAVRPVLRGIDLEAATIPDLQRAMNRHKLTSVQLTSFYLRRIKALNPRLHAVIATNPDALRIASASDKRRRHGGARSPLEGIPVLLKDNIDTRDREPTTAGSLALARSKPARDAFLVRRLRAAGAVVIGKANLSEWANFRGNNSSSGWSAVGGQTNNPYVLDRNPCGSSSGSAVGVSANLATVAIGTETDGSIVCPSGQNGVVGIKPTLGLVSRSGVVPISAEQDTAGPMGKHVVDAALTLSVLRGVDPADPATASSAPFQGVNYLAGFGRGALRGKRIGLWLAGTGVENVPAVAQVMADTTAALTRLGATVVPADLPYQDQIGEPEFAALLVEFKHDINAYLAARPGPHPADLAGLIEFNKRLADVELKYFGQEIFEQAQATSGDLTDPTYLQQRRTATSLAQRSIDETVARLDLDAIVAPTNGPAWVTRLPGGDTFDEFVSSSTPAAVGGYPAVTVPAGFAGPTPIGVSFLGGRYQEAALLPLADAFERGTRERRPPQFLPTVGS